MTIIKYISNQLQRLLSQTLFFYFCAILCTAFEVYTRRITPSYARCGRILQCHVSNKLNLIGAIKRI